MKYMILLCWVYIVDKHRSYASLSSLIFVEIQATKTKMKILLLVVATFLLFNECTATNYLSVGVTPISATTAVINIDVYLDGDSISNLALWNIEDDTYGCRTDGGSPNIFFDTSNTDPAFKRVTITMTPSTFQDGNNVDVNCPFKYPVNGKYAFYVRTFVTDPDNLSPGTDKEFALSVPIDQVLTINDPGTTTFSAALGVVVVTTVTEDTVTTALEVVAAGSPTAQTSFDLGDPVQLQFTMTSDPYEATTSLAGARITTCIADKQSSFTDSPVTFVGQDGCFDDTGLFQNPVTSGGFYKTAGFTTSTTRTFIAYSNHFEMSGFFEGNLNGVSNLYFKCSLTFCYDDSITTAGTCGGEHCDPVTRKRRHADIPHTTVTTNITVTQRKSEQKGCENCSDSYRYKATVGTLGTICALMFSVMLFAYSNVRSAIKSEEEKMREKTTSSHFMPQLDTLSTKGNA